MGKFVVVYHSYRGVTPKLVDALKKGIESKDGQCEIIQANEANPEHVLTADTLVLASGQPFNSLAGPVKAFLERCWNYEGKKQFAGKRYVTILNGAKEPKDVAAYIDSVMMYFKMEKAADGLTCMAQDIDSAIAQAEKLGEQLA